MHKLIAPGLILRKLGKDDAARLSSYFDGLSADSRRRFQPHPLTSEFASSLCAEEGSATVRFVVENADRIVGYFILEPVVSAHEIERYSHFGIVLKSGQDYLFAPSVADDFQNKGIASLVMPHLVAYARQSGAKSLVLMGGTQATNVRAIAFYEKFGFKRFGGYQTDVFNHDMRLTISTD